jgi:hypothetical protein
MDQDLNSSPKDNVVLFPGATRLDLSPAAVLKDAAKAGLTSVVVLGYGQGDELFLSTSTGNGPEILWLLEACKMIVLQAGGAIQDSD